MRSSSLCHRNVDTIRGPRPCVAAAVTTFGAGWFAVIRFFTTVSAKPFDTLYADVCPVIGWSGFGQMRTPVAMTRSSMTVMSQSVDFDSPDLDWTAPDMTGVPSISAATRAPTAFRSAHRGLSRPTVNCMRPGCRYCMVTFPVQYPMGPLRCRFLS